MSLRTRMLAGSMLAGTMLTGSMLALPQMARAAAIDGVYVGAGIGANFLQDERVGRVTYPQAGGSTGNLGNVRLNFGAGFAGVGSVGYGFGNGLRTEVEGNYRWNDLDGIGQSSGSTFNAGFQRFPNTRTNGDEKKAGGMVNVLYDFDGETLGIGRFPLGLTPYVGVGAGYEWIWNNNFQVASANTLYRGNDSKGSWAYQGIIGAAFPIDSVPGMAITAEYRFLGLAENRSYNFQYFEPGLATRARVHEEDNYNHSLMLGVRYAFNQAPPPAEPAPMAAPAPAPARTYLVFFDWDRADLTDRARQIIAQAATASTQVQTTRIDVQGNADRSGTPAYNQKLSLRRAQVVAAELVRNGVAKGEIGIQAFGDTNPLVPTAAGVREPQNRRVEIILH